MLSITDKITYINCNIHILSRDDLLYLLRYIHHSGVPKEAMHKKVNGTQIKYSNIPIVCINEIYSYIEKVIIDKTEETRLKTE